MAWMVKGSEWVGWLSNIDDHPFVGTNGTNGACGAGRETAFKFVMGNRVVGAE